MKGNIVPQTTDSEQQMNNTGALKKDCASTFSTILMKFLVRPLPAVLLAAFVIYTLYSSLLKRDKIYYAKESLVIRDTAGINHYIGKGNKVAIVENRTLILQSDTVEIGDSLTKLVAKEYLIDQPEDDCYQFIKNEDIYKDTFVVAEVKKDLALCSINKGNMLYVREKERFLVKDSMENADSVSLLFNDKEFLVSTDVLKFDSISQNVIDSFLNDFNALFVIRDKAKQQFAIRMKSLPKEVTFSIYSVYEDRLLCKIRKADTTYLIKINYTPSNTSDSLKLRVASVNNLSYVLTAQEAVPFVVEKNALHAKAIYQKFDLSIILFALLVLYFIIVGLYRFCNRNGDEPSDDENQKNKWKKDEERLKKELQELSTCAVILPEDPNEYEQWFKTLDSKNGELGLYTLSKTLLDDWLTASRVNSEDANTLLSKFQENTVKYLASVHKDEDVSDEIKKKTAELEQVRAELAKCISESEEEAESVPTLVNTSDDKEQLYKKIRSLEADNTSLKDQLTSSKDELVRLKQNMSDEIEKANKKVKSVCEEQVRKVEEKTRKEIGEADERTRKAKARAEEAEKKSRTIREEVTGQFKAEIQKLKEELKNRQNMIDQTAQALKQTEWQLKAKKQECANLSQDLQNKKEALKAFSERITDVQPASAYAKTVLKLLQVGHNVEKAADKLLEKSVDDYLLTKYITRYQKALHQLDMDQFTTDVLNIANVQFVYRQQPLAKYDQYDVKKFKESMKLFFFESYLGKYIDALMVFNETMAGLHHLVDGLTESDAKVFEKCRKDLNSVFKDLEIEVHSVKIFDSITDNVDLSVTMRPLDFDCPPGTICQIDSCLVYLAGGNKPSDKIHVIVKE